MSRRAASGVDESSPWRIVGRFDLDSSSVAKVDLSGTAPHVPIEVDAAAGLESWSKTHTVAERLFWSTLSPVAMFWDVPATNQPFVPFLARTGPQSNSRSGTGSVRGFAARAFLPVLVESRTGEAQLSWASDASEFWASGLSAGSYRIRAMDHASKATFARGVHVWPGSLTSLDSGLAIPIDRGEPLSREVMGFVHWENGSPAANAVVFMQHSGNFRNFLRRVEADEHGFFNVVGVRGDEPYFVFATPPGVEAAVRNFEFFSISLSEIEVWRDLILHPHRLTGNLPGSVSTRPLQLVRIEADAEQVVWTFSATAERKFGVSNVPHGRYRVRTVPDQGGACVRSQPFDVTAGCSEIQVRWSESSSLSDESHIQG